MTTTIQTDMNINKQSLNEDIAQFPQIHAITDEMYMTHEDVSRLIMLDRYAFKDTEKKTLKEGDFVVLTVKPDPQFPARGYGFVKSIDWKHQEACIKVAEEFLSVLEDKLELETGVVKRHLSVIDKPLEIYYEQIAKRNAIALSNVETSEEKRRITYHAFTDELTSLRFVPAGRVLHGAGSETNVTYFNCYVMPYIHDSREGIADHRKQVIEIMSRGGGVGTNGSTLRPRHTLARAINGKSSGAVSWLDDIAKLTHLVDQGGSRHGAQMIMLADWHPDILEFIISKMQNPSVLRYLMDHTEDWEIKKIAAEKLKFTPLTKTERSMYQGILNYKSMPGLGGFTKEAIDDAEQTLQNGGFYSVHHADFLTGANISVCITKEFMEAIQQNAEYALRFPDVENYTAIKMAAYNKEWHEYGDVRTWEEAGYPVRTYRTIKARELWKLINICATYAAEPGVFFIDHANDQTNAKSYGQQVVATNPCGEQPLAPHSVCHLAAINLAEMTNKDTKTVDFEQLIKTVEIGVHMQDNVIDATPYFLENNKKQALGERRVGLGVMGLHDLLIYCEIAYGSKEGNTLVDKVFETIATTAYRTSIELAKEKGSFPFLIGKTKKQTKALREAFINTGYMKQMPIDIREGIVQFGIRNSHLLTVAPTGSTGTMIGVSTGVEPYFSFSYFRSGRLGKFMEVNCKIVEEFLASHPEQDMDHLPDWFVTAMDLKPETHADTQCVIQRWVDSSISKTVHAPKGYTTSQVRDIYQRLYYGGAKGGTVYVDGSRDTQVLT